MHVGMTRSFIARYVSPWALRKDKQLLQRVAALRERDGDNCRRCRRPIRFDLTRGHDKGPKVELIASDGTNVGTFPFSTTHVRVGVEPPPALGTPEVGTSTA